MANGTDQFALCLVYREHLRFHLERGQTSRQKSLNPVWKLFEGYIGAFEAVDQEKVKGRVCMSRVVGHDWGWGSLGTDPWT